MTGIFTAEHNITRKLLILFNGMKAALCLLIVLGRVMSKISHLKKIAAVAMLSSGLAHANLVLNGDFETGTFANWTSSGAVGPASDAAYIAGAGATGPLPSGHFFAAFGGGNQPATGVLSQTFATVVGAQYLLSFDYGKYGAPGGPQGIAAMVSNAISNTTLATLNVTDASGTTALGSVFSAYNQSFIATSALTRLTFSDFSAGTDSTDGFLDNVAVNGPSPNVVPEPGSLALIGLGLAGLAIIRKRKHV